MVMAAPAAVSSLRDGRTVYQCGTCSQSYTRLDHLARHMRSHTQEKPYHCTICDKRFARADLLSRHATTLHGPDVRDSHTKRRRTTASAARVSQACAACADNHLKCEDQKPCRRCQRRSITCQVVKRGVGGENTDSPSSMDMLNLSTSNHQEDTAASQSRHPEAAGVTTLPSASPTLPLYHHNQTTSNNGVSLTSHLGHEDTLPSNCEPFMPQPNSDFFPVFTSRISGTQTPRGLINFGLETDLDLSAIDLSFLNSYNTRIPFEYDDPSPPSHIHPTNSVPRQQDATVERRYKRSIWHFVPVPEDHRFAEQDNLSLPPQVGTGNVSLGKSSTIKYLDQGSRDKILAIVLSQVQPRLSQALSSFPSVELLDTLIQFFLASPASGAGSWMGGGGFQGKESHPVLLLAMAAAGSVLTPDVSLRKLGYALQEVVRNHLPGVFEDDNTTIRNIELHQAFLLHLEIGQWSGNSRKIEIAESFHQPLITMLRRGGKLDRSAYPIITVRIQDDGQELEELWRAWFKQESFKRLVYHLLQFEAHTSIALLTTSLISYAELDLPLPDSPALWAATTAQEWKSIYLNIHPGPGAIRLPSFTECIGNLDLLESSRNVGDLPISCSSFLCGVWGLVWEYRQLRRVHRNQPRYWDSGMIMESRYQELRKVLDCFCISYPNESILLRELILMHLHMPLEEIQQSAGLEEVHPVQQTLREWAQSQASRRAVWHAGQVVREARVLPSQHFRDFNAVALYHAGLAFWAYGVSSRVGVSSSSPHPGRGQSPPQSEDLFPVWLDDIWGEAVNRFISLEKGMPALHHTLLDKPPSNLCDINAVLDVVLGVMRQEHQPHKLRPPLVENLIHLLEGLRDSSGNNSQD